MQQFKFKCALLRKTSILATEGYEEFHEQWNKPHERNVYPDTLIHND